MASCTSSVSAALQTDGREVLALKTMSVACFKSAVSSTKIWQLPTPVSMTGTREFSTTLLIRPAPPLGMSTSSTPLIRIMAVALSREVSPTSWTHSAGSPAFSRPRDSALTMAVLERMASFPPRKITTLPALRHSAAASLVTLGLAS